jgi:hypothetical protein
MRFVVFLAFSLRLSVAAEIPAGTNFNIRLTTPASTIASRVGDRTEAILIAPVRIRDQVAIPAGAKVTGVVAMVTAPSEVQNATLKLDFTGLSSAKIGSAKIAARVIGIDNAREAVDATGIVQGISPKNTITGRLDQGLGKMENSRLGGLAQVLEAAKTLLVRNADPNIDCEPGTELSLRLLKPLTVKDMPQAVVLSVPDDGRLADLVLHQTAQTYASHPYRPSDITNLIFIGDLDRVREAFQEAGWVGADHLSGFSKWETARAVIEQRGYKEAPVSVILLDEHPPDLVFQKTNNTFSARHHLRIWHSPDTYQGQQVWLCGATHDIGIDYSDQDKTFIHKIDSNIDLERQKVTDDLTLTGKVRGTTLISRPGIPTNFRNATGDDVSTDGRVAVLQF